LIVNNLVVNFAHFVLKVNHTLARQCESVMMATTQVYMEKLFEPSPRQNPLTDLRQNWHTWLCRGHHRVCGIFVVIGYGMFCSPYTWFCRIAVWNKNDVSRKSRAVKRFPEVLCKERT